MFSHIFFILLVVKSTSAYCGPCRKFGEGWIGTKRADGTTMCIKAFFEELENKTYSEVRKFCTEQGGFVAPISSAQEQKTLEFILKDKRDKDGSLYIGGIKVGNKTAVGEEAEYIWEFDNSKVTFAKWGTKQPDNHRHDHLSYEHEDCITVFVGRGDYWHTKWNDQNCAPEGLLTYYKIIGGVCGKKL